MGPSLNLPDTDHPASPASASTSTATSASTPLSRTRLLRFLGVVLPIFALCHGFVVWSLVPHLALGPWGSGLGWAYGLLSTLVIPLGMLGRFLLTDQDLADRLAWLGSLAMGFFSSLFVLALLRVLFLPLLGHPDWADPSAWGVLVLALTMTVAGYVGARRLPRVVSVQVPLPDLPPELEGFTLVQLSDLHVGATIKADTIARVVDRVNELNADAVVITGDVVDGTVPRLAPHTAPLARLRARQGSFLVTGNHEYYAGVGPWIAEFRRLGLCVLLNEHRVLQGPRGGQVVLAGVTDYTAGQFDPTQASDPVAALAGAPAGLPRILLAHQPRSATAAAAAGAHLQLSGHTHGGQFWPWNHFVRLQQPFTAGLARHGALWVYTSRGTGYWGPPKRFLAPAEITRITLTRA